MAAFLVAAIVLGGIVLAVSLFIGFFVAIISFAKRREQEGQALWAQVAREHGLAAHGRDISGRKHGVWVRACTVVRGSGKNRTTYTVVSARLDMPLDLGLEIREHGFITDLFHSSPDVVIGDPPFDTRFVVSADEPHRVQAVLSPELRALLMRGLSGRFSFGDHGVTVECLGATNDPRWLGWALELTARATSLLDRQRKQVPVASALRAHQSAWAAFAAANGFRGADTPLSMWGKIDRSNVSAYAVRTGMQLYQLEVHVQFPQPLGIGLSVQPMGMMDKVAVFFGGEDLRVGVPAFDPVFRVKASNPEACREVLSREICAEILGVHTRVGPVSLDDRGFAVRLSAVPHDPSSVPRTVHHLTGVIERIAAGAAHATHGPYR